MSRATRVYEIHSHPTDTTPHAQVTSTGAGNVQDIACPEGAYAFVIAVESTAARVTFDGSTPSATNGLLFPAGAVPSLQPYASDMQFESDAGTDSIVDVLWLM